MADGQSEGGGHSMQHFEQREAELRRLNDQLERRKVAVVRQAEEAVRKQELRLSYDEGRAGAEANEEEAVAAAGTELLPPGSLGADAEHEHDPVADEMGPAATVRYQRAKLRVLEQEMERLVTENKQKGQALADEKRRSKQACDEVAQLQRQLKAAAKENEKHKRLSDMSARKLETAELELASAKKELEVAVRTQRANKGDISTKDVRLNRALEELEKYKGLLKERKTEELDKNEDVRREADRLARDNKKLEGQKAALVAAFRKQAKLIDVLKRQKLHIEAARMLAFTEEEFAKSLQGND
eukprot:SAG22_NODE_495_length_9802_cov_111.077605_3_plen_300_part_00